MTSATRQLQEHGQSIWLDNITRTLLTSGTLARYVDQLSVTGLTSNPTILDKAIEGSDAYDETIRASAASGEPLLFELALDDLRAAAEMVPPELRNRLGIAVATQTYAAYRDLLASERWRRLHDVGAYPQRLLWASTGTKDPSASDVHYVEALAAALTINTMPDTTLLAFADHGYVRGLLPEDGGDVDQTLDEFTQADIGLDALALRLQQE